MTQEAAHDDADGTLVLPPAPAVGSTDDQSPAALREQLAAWLASPALTTLLDAERAQPSGNLGEQLAYLDGFSAAVWDFRGLASDKGALAERNQVNRDAVTGEREARVVAVAHALGMVDPRPPNFDSYDHVFTLGGLVRACAWRTEYAAHLVRHAVKAEAVTALTAYRKLAANANDAAQDEPTLLREFGLPARSFEVEVMEDAVLTAFRAPPFEVLTEGDPNASPNERFRVARSHADGIELTVVAAPDPASSQRADTGTTMRYWAQHVANVKPGDRILNVTSAIYLPFQHANAIQNFTLPYGAVVDTVAIDHSVVPPRPVPQVFRGVNYLQEIRSTVRAYRSLLAALDRESSA